MTAKVRVGKNNPLQKRFLPHCGLKSCQQTFRLQKSFCHIVACKTCLPLQKCWVCQRWRNQMTAKYSKNLRISHLDTYTLGLDICERSMFVSQRAKIYANDSSIPLWSFQVYFYHTVQNHYWIQNKLIQFQKRLLEQSMSFKVSDATLARTVG